MLLWVLIGLVAGVVAGAFGAILSVRARKGAGLDDTQATARRALLDAETAA